MVEKMKKIMVLILLANISLIAKEYSLNDLLYEAVKNSSFSKQGSNYTEISKKEISDIISNYYPQINFEGQATYQSDMFKIPLNIPNMTLPDLRKDQYNVWLNFTQMIWDGGLVSNKVDISEISTKVNIENTNAKLRNIVEITANLYFAGKKIEANIKSISTVMNTLESNKKQISSLVKNGVLNQSNLDAINIQISSKEQSMQSLKKDYASVLEKLNLLIAKNDLEKLGQIEIAMNNSDMKINRSELKAMDYYQELNNVKSDINYSMLMPKISAFAKLGYSNPNQLNMFEQDWSEYYMVGVRFSWKPFSWFSESKNAEIAKLQNENIELEKQEFEKQINIQLIQEKSEMDKQESIIQQDKLIIELQNNITKEKYSQFLNGTATISEYINEINSLQIYETNLSIHNIMLENAKTNLLIKSGNYKGVE